jgi:hypothetical protein
MIDEQANPPRLAQLILGVTLRPIDADTVAGDLLEEYRAVRRPSLGRLKADAWYWGHALSVVAHLVWPFALALVAARIALAMFLAFPLSGGWNPSLVPAPNVSLWTRCSSLAPAISVRAEPVAWPPVSSAPWRSA